MGGRPSAAPPHSLWGHPQGRAGGAGRESRPAHLHRPSLLCRATAPRRDRRALRSLDLVSSLPVDGQMARKPQIRRLDPGLLRQVSAVRVEMGRVLASHVRATVVALGAVSALALTGCSDGAGAQPGPSKSGPPSSTTTASPAPSSTASTTASPSGTATVTVPAAARAHTEEGAKAFARFFYETRRVELAVDADSSAPYALCRPATASACRAFMKLVDEYKSAGQHIDRDLSSWSTASACVRTRTSRSSRRCAGTDERPMQCSCDGLATSRPTSTAANSPSEPHRGLGAAAWSVTDSKVVQ